MVTLIAVYSGDGECLGRCNAACYDATHAECTCICKGANHGAGKERATQNTRQACKAWLDDYAEEHTFSEVEVPALYTAQSRTATKIARTINANCETQGNNVVLDVRRVLRPQGGWGWEVDEKAIEPFHMTTTFYPSLRAVREGNGQMKMFAGIDAFINPKTAQPVKETWITEAMNAVNPEDSATFELLRNTLIEKANS